MIPLLLSAYVGTRVTRHAKLEILQKSLFPRSHILLMNEKEIFLSLLPIIMCLANLFFFALSLLPS